MNMTLSKLKQTAELYEWALVHNSWYVSVPEFQSAWRKVSWKSTTALALITYDPRNNGEPNNAHIYWPKASETTITHDSCHWVVTINRIIPADKNMQREESIHTMIYHLRPNLDAIAA